MGSNTNEELRKYRKKRKKRLKRSSIVLILFMLCYLAYHYITLEIRYQELVQRRHELSTELKESENLQQHLYEQVENSQSDKYIERLARKYFGLVYPDEKVYIEKEVE